MCDLHFRLSLLTAQIFHDSYQVLCVRQVPIFHVNGDDVEAVVRVCQLSAEWRQVRELLNAGLPRRVGSAEVSAQFPAPDLRDKCSSQGLVNALSLSLWGRRPVLHL